MRADNDGEGGILALMSFTLKGKGARATKIIVTLGILGAALFYGDSIITPAISVLSAVEGLRIAFPQITQLHAIIVSILILTCLFAAQSHGTSRIGVIFGPIMLLWFGVLGLLGLFQLSQNWAVLAALNPFFAFNFIFHHQLAGFLVFGSILLVLTGGEALYADMGHFARRPIMLAWYCVAWPGLMLNYFGQGAMLLAVPATKDNPFFHMVPSWGTLPLVILASLASIIASQAVISGAFSLTSAAIKLGFAPRFKIVHTNENERGQIYLPAINWLLWAMVILLVLAFQSSTAMASAYGFAVVTTMMIDDMLLLIVMITIWKWHKIAAISIFVVLFTTSFTFFAATSIKFMHGGWFPAVIGVIVFFILTTWKRGKFLIHKKERASRLLLETFFEKLLTKPLARVEGTAMYMQNNLSYVPTALLHNLKHNQVLHSRNVFLNIRTENVPYVDNEHKIQIKAINECAYMVTTSFGFKEEPAMPHIMRLCAKQNLKMKLNETSFYIDRKSIKSAKEPEIIGWRRKLFSIMLRNSVRPTDYFQIPANRVVELGTQIEI